MKQKQYPVEWIAEVLEQADSLTRTDERTYGARSDRC